MYNIFREIPDLRNFLLCLDYVMLRKKGKTNDTEYCFH